MDDLSEVIKTSFEAISLILIFVFVLFDLRYPQIMEDLAKEIPLATRTKERIKHKSNLTKTLFLKSIPLVAILGVILYLFLPTSIRVLSESEFQLWRFDLLRTAFLIVFGLIFIFFVWSVVLLLRLVSRIKTSQ
jgi:hypothetical protein